MILAVIVVTLLLAMAAAMSFLAWIVAGGPTR